jgi:hypothetical protein
LGLINADTVMDRDKAAVGDTAADNMVAEVDNIVADNMDILESSCYFYT